MEITLLKASDSQSTRINHDRGDKSWAAVPVFWKARATRSQGFISCGSCCLAGEVLLAGHCSSYRKQPFGDYAEFAEEDSETSL